MTKYLFCVDSDGCVMDTMTYKHQQFFGPLAAKIFEIPKQETQRFLKRMNSGVKIAEKKPRSFVN